MPIFEAIVVFYLVIAGLGLTFWGREAFDIGWYSERAWAPMLGIPSFALGAIGVYALLGGPV